MLHTKFIIIIIIIILFQEDNIFGRVASLTYGQHHVNKVSWKSACWFRRRRFLKGFYHIWAWRPSLSCDQHHVIRFYFLVSESFHKKIGSDW